MNCSVVVCSVVAPLPSPALNGLNVWISLQVEDTREEEESRVYWHVWLLLEKKGFV